MLTFQGLITIAGLCSLMLLSYSTGMAIATEIGLGATFSLVSNRF
jgi:hypothetical protein